MRSGTENVPGIAAFGEAVRIGTKEFRERYAHVSYLKTYLTEKIEGDEALSEISITKPESSAPLLSTPSANSEVSATDEAQLGMRPTSAAKTLPSTGRLSTML